MKHKKIAIAGFSASMLLGAGTGLVLNLPGSAGASSAATTPDDTAATTDSTGSSDTTDSTGTTVAADPAAPADSPTGVGPAFGHPGSPMVLENSLAGLVTAGTITQEQADAITAAVDAKRTADDEAEPTDGTRPTRGAFLTESLAELVTAGTITQAQSDAVTSAIEASRPIDGPGRGPGWGHGIGGDHGRAGFGGPGFGEAAATAIDITTAELKTELAAGKTIADVATEKGVDVQTVIDAIVAAQTADITERVTDLVNGVRPQAPTPPPADDSPTTTTG